MELDRLLLTRHRGFSSPEYLYKAPSCDRLSVVEREVGGLQHRVAFDRLVTSFYKYLSFRGRFFSLLCLHVSMDYI